MGKLQLQSVTGSTVNTSAPMMRPCFDDLPLDRNGPPGNAWGLYGAKDQLGRLNLLSSDTVVSAAKEIQSGVRISLDWSLDNPSPPSYGRSVLLHEIRRRGTDDRPVNDDVLHLNTQSSSQWDGFRHYGYLHEKLYYGGRTNEDIDHTSELGIDAWAASGGIVGRGVFLDYASFAERNHVPLKPFETTIVPLSALLQIATEQNITFREGDILFVRTGFTMAYEALSTSQKHAQASRLTAEFAGLESSKDMLRWLWNSGFAAVAADCPAFESSPVGRSTYSTPETALHPWLLAGWGMPIGELFDLERLAQHCKTTGRWSFFLSSVPLKVPGGVASPPNAIAIF